MINGRVSAELDSLVTIEIRNGQGGLQAVEVVVDTGFNGESDLVQSLSLEYIDDVPVVLADLQQRPVRAYEGVVSWQRRHREVLTPRNGQ